MELRKLEREEHYATRSLWEAVFSEDTEAFLNYYYKIKTKDNQIYVIDEDAKIRAMLQLNPYRVQIAGNKFTLHYIIAVATEEKYRGRGMMRQLLLQSMQDMYKKKEPFTFLMPAAEAIYTPYDFRFVYNQAQMELIGRDMETDILVKEAAIEDAGKLAAFARKMIQKTYQVYAIHSKSYYEMMIQEQRSENGGVKMVYSGRKLVGTFAYGNEGSLEIREPLFMEGYEKSFLQAIYEMADDETTSVSCIGLMDNLQNALGRLLKENEEKCGIEKKPMIMARILHLESFLKTLVTIDQQPLQCSFAIIDPLIIQNNRIVRMEYRPDLDEMFVKDTEDSDAVLTIDAFTSLIFGYRTMEEIDKVEGVLLTEKFKAEFSKIRLLNQIFLNEIV